MHPKNEGPLSSASEVGVLLANTGTPDEATPESVRGYLEQFLMDDRIVPMPKPVWWVILHAFILPKRSVASAEKYKLIWTDEGSPLAVAGNNLALKLEREYVERGLNVSVRCAMTYGNPSIPETMESFESEGCDRIVVLPLYPQQAFSTTKAVEDHVRDAVIASGWEGQCDFISDYYDNESYAAAVAGSVKDAGFNVASGDRLLFAFHSIPMKDIENGDDYDRQTRVTSGRVAEILEIPDSQWEIGYQCRFDKNRKWLMPTTKTIVDQWLVDDAANGGGNVNRTFVVCPGFAVECLETIFDVERELKEHYFEKVRSLGMEPLDDSFVYVPCLNESEAHVDVLRNVLHGYIEF